jgi:hypothetical protein
MPRPDPLPPQLTLAAGGPSNSGFMALEAAAGAMRGHRLFSGMLHDGDGGRPLFTRGEPWLRRDAAGICATVPDDAPIESLGCAAALNLPVRWQGRTPGMLNLLHQAGWYDIADLPAGLAMPVLPGNRRQL